MWGRNGSKDSEENRWNWWNTIFSVPLNSFFPQINTHKSLIAYLKSCILKLYFSTILPTTTQKIVNMLFTFEKIDQNSILIAAAQFDIYLFVLNELIRNSYSRNIIQYVCTLSTMCTTLTNLICIQTNIAYPRFPYLFGEQKNTAAKPWNSNPFLFGFHKIRFQR